MKKRFSEMSAVELAEEIRAIQAELASAQFPSQRDMLISKLQIAKSYEVCSESFEPGLYRIEGMRPDQLFRLRTVNGIMAWGTMGQDSDASFPLSLLIIAPGELA